MLRKLPVIAVGLLVALAVLILLLDAIAPSLLDPRNIAAWRRNRAATSPMAFYALVVDDRGNPVEGAAITLRLDLHDSKQLLGRGFVREEGVILTTDADGRAELTGRTGFSIIVVGVSKPGYRWLYDLDGTQRRGEVRTDNRTFHYGDLLTQYVPDPDNPAVFPLLPRGCDAAEPECGRRRASVARGLHRW